MIPWIIIAVGVLVILLGIVYIFSIKKHKRPVDYYNLFIIGLIWTVIGIPLKNLILGLLGILFMVVGLVNKNKWKKNRKRWKNLSKDEKIITIVIMVILLLLVIVGLILFILGGI